MHYGVLGQKWGIRRYQNEDGTLTDRGKSHYKQLLSDDRSYVDKDSSKRYIRGKMLIEDFGYNADDVDKKYKKERRLQNLASVAVSAASSILAYKGIIPSNVFVGAMAANVALSALSGGISKRKEMKNQEAILEYAKTLNKEDYNKIYEKANNKYKNFYSNLYDSMGYGNNKDN